MITAAIAIFSLTAILGMILFSFVLKGKATPKSIVFTHGPLTLIGIILLTIYTYKHDAKSIESLILFVIAASGGLFMVVRDILGHPVPKWLAILHGLLAITGFIFLLIFQYW